MQPSSESNLTTTAFSVMALALVATGCSDGSEMGLSTNRGSGSLTEGTTVENAYIVPTFLPGRCAIQLGDGAELRFTVTNGSPTETERLLSVSTNVSDHADTVPRLNIPVRSTVGFGQSSAPSVDAGGTVSAVQLSALDQSVRPGMSANVTFHFDRAGDITMPVPIEACPRQDR
jgi:hypothetical protein